MTIQRLMVAPHIPYSPIDDAKTALRARAMQARAGLDPITCGESLAAHVLLAMAPLPGAIVAGFWPIGDEIDVRPLLSLLRDKGHEIVLPITPRRGNPMTFGLWSLSDSLIPERFGTMRPTGPERTPTYLLVPLLAFDRTGARLGYGAGYYDRTLALIPHRIAIGCAYAAQMVDEVPIGPYDIRLDAVATENGVIRFNEG